MKCVVAFALALCLIGSSPLRAGAQPPEISCGGFWLGYETTIGAVGKHPRSVIAVAAITTHRSYSRALGWMVFDERGDRWIVVTPTSPSDLSTLASRVNGMSAGSKGRIAALRKPLPARYRLTDCPAITPA